MEFSQMMSNPIKLSSSSTPLSNSTAVFPLLPKTLQGEEVVTANVVCQGNKQKYWASKREEQGHSHSLIKAKSNKLFKCVNNSVVNV